MRVVIDINIIVSALLAPAGKPAAIIRIWLDGRFTLLTCAAHIDELRSKPAGWSTRSKSWPRTSRLCRAWIALPIPPTIFYWRCPKAAGPITSSRATRAGCLLSTAIKPRGSSPHAHARHCSVEPGRLRAEIIPAPEKRID